MEEEQAAVAAVKIEGEGSMRLVEKVDKIVKEEGEVKVVKRGGGE